MAYELPEAIEDCRQLSAEISTLNQQIGALRWIAETAEVHARWGMTELDLLFPRSQDPGDRGWVLRQRLQAIIDACERRA